VGKPEGKRTLGRPRWRWVDNLRIDLVEVGLGDVIGQVEGSCEFSIEPSSSIKCWETIEWLHNSWPLSSIELVSYSGHKTSGKIKMMYNGKSKISGIKKHKRTPWSVLRGQHSHKPSP
jgi:hypothetical protein